MPNLNTILPTMVPLAPIIRGEAQVVYGGAIWSQKPMMRLGNQFHLAHQSALAARACTTWRPKVMTIDGAPPDLNNRFDLEPEITAKVARMGQRIVEVPISYWPREAKKLSPWRDGLPAVRALLRYRTWKPAA